MLRRSALSTLPFIFFFFFNDTATTEIYTLSLHDALPISLVELLLLALPGQIERLRDLVDALQVSAQRQARSEEHTSELQSQSNLVCRLLLEKKKQDRRGRRRKSREELRVGN